MVRKIVNILGIVCLLLVLGAGGTAGYLAIKGTLTRQSLKTAAAAITGNAIESAGTQPAGESGARSVASRPQSGEDLAGGTHAGSSQDENEAAEAGRLEMMGRQLANEQALLDAARVKLQRDQEQFDQDRKQWEGARQKELASSQLGGVQKDLDYLSSIKPAQALALLRTRSDDQASRILMAMETRKGKKIIELCKTTDEKEWVKRILELIRQQSNIQAQALTGG